MDDVPLLELAARQHGLITHTQARGLGWSAAALRRLIQSGSWIRMLPGVVRSVATPVSFRQTAMAAVLWASSGAVASHVTAARLWRLDGATDLDRRIDVTIPRRLDRRSDIVTVHRSTDLPRSDRDAIDGIAVTSATGTLVDLAGVVPVSVLELAAEDAFRRRLTSPLTHEDRTIRVDLAYPDRRLAIEFDSLRWHSGRTKLETDAERRNLLRAARWQLVTITASMLGTGGKVAVDPVRTAYADLADASWGQNARQAREISP
jgi:hypothetical protein